LTYVIIDADLITALVERWREETHTFYLPFGEVTVTLQDVNVLLGLKIDGMPITGRVDYNWRRVFDELLGLVPPSDAYVGSSLKLSWLKENFQGEPEVDNEVVMNHHIRAYLLFLIGTLLCPDKSGNTVPLMYLPLLEDLDMVDDYSWGSATLACLYRNLCKACTGNASQIAGCLILLQLWSWERIGMGRPEVVTVPDYIPPCPEYPLGSQMQVGLDPLGCRWLGIKRRYKDHKLAYGVYRQILDMLTEEQFIWEPYTVDVLECLHERCKEEREAYLVKVPLICFYMVELHNPDRCVRQFGWYQQIPDICSTQPSMHAIDNRTNEHDYTSGVFKEYLEEWNDRRENVLDAGIPYVGRMSYEDPYMSWYLQHTRRLICPTSSCISDHTRAAHEFQPSYTDVQSMVSTSLRFQLHLCFCNKLIHYSTNNSSTNNFMLLYILVLTILCFSFTRLMVTHISTTPLQGSFQICPIAQPWLKTPLSNNSRPYHFNNCKTLTYAI